MPSHRLALGLLGLLFTAGLLGCSGAESLPVPDAGEPDAPGGPPTLIMDPTRVDLVEGGQTAVQVRLSAAPTQTLRVAVATEDASVAQVSTDGLTFTASSWSVAQSVTITAPEDPNTARDTTSIGFALDGEVTHLPVDVADNDPVTTTGVVVDPAALTVREGTGGSFNVSLSCAPSAAVMVSVTAANPDLVTLEWSTLTFTPSNWSAPQRVTVDARSDANTVQDTTSIQVVATIGDTRPAASVAVAVPDDDTLALVVSHIRVLVAEGASETVQVRLNAEPTDPVTIDVTSAQPAIASASPAQLSFTRLNWSVEQVVTITGEHDVDTSNDATTVQLAGGGLSTTIPVEVFDSGTGSILAAPRALRVGERGTSATAIRLSGPPAAPVTVSLTSRDAQIATVSPAQLTFDATDWSTPKTITIAGVPDGDVSDNDVEILAEATGPAADRPLPASIDVTVVDDLELTLLVSPTALSIQEGESGAFTVALRDRPNTDTEVIIASNNNDVSVNRESLTFNRRNFATPQQVRVRALDDLDLDPGAADLSLVVGGRLRAQVAVSVTDDDRGGSFTSRRSFSATEGGRARSDTRR